MRKLTSNPYLLFLPFLFLYAGIVLLGHKDAMEGDEGRYFQYAENLLRGFYSPPGEVYLWNGPGYPLILAPFLAVHAPLLFDTLLNALFQYLSLVFLFRTMILFIPNRIAFWFALCWGSYYVAFKEMTLLYTEPLSCLLICLFLYYCALALAAKTKHRYLLAAGFFLGYLTLTKIVFGYILLTLLIVTIISLLIKRFPETKKFLYILLVAIIINLPYLFYTYHLTGKVFYWASSGGMSLYWASTPFKDESGDWNDDHFTAYCYDNTQPCNAQQFANNHQADYDSIYKYTGVLRDEAFRKKGVENIKAHPGKYLRNCIANTGRLFFNMPNSYSYERFQKKLIRIPAGLMIALMFCLATVFSFVYLKQFPLYIWVVAAFVVLYVGANIIVSATQRQLCAIVPAIILWSALATCKIIRSSQKKPAEHGMS